MKLSTVTAKLTGTKLVRTFVTTAITGAALMLGASVAQAQHVAFGVQFGEPAYVDPGPAVVYQQPGYYYNNGYYDGDRYAAWRAHEAHEQWERQEAWRHREHEEHERMEHMGYGGYGYGGYYGDHDGDRR